MKQFLYNGFFKKSFSLIFLLFLCLFSFGQISVSGGTGLSATYTSLTKAGGLFAALNAGGSQSGNSIIVTITADVTNEDGVNTLSQGDWTSITISPSGARTISGTATSSTSATAGLISLNGADNVTINGLNAGGNSLTITNTSVGNASAILFRNDATNNTVTNCTIQGSGVWQRGGVVVITAPSTSGNDNNTISNNNITSAGSNRPTVGIYAVGSGSVFNDNVNIQNNNIYDYFRGDSLNCGIRIDSNNASHTISGNKIYQPSLTTSTTLRYTVAYTHCGILIAVPNNGNGFTVSNNSIGGNNSSNTGTWVMTSAGALATRFVGISASFGAGATSNISTNTVTNIYLSSSNTGAAGNSSLCGIQLLGSGTVNINGNTIGSTTGGATVDYPSAGFASMYVLQRASLGGVVGINNGSTGTVVVSNNIVGSLRAKDSLVTYGSVAYPFYNSGVAASLTINDNTFGNATPNNIVAGTLSTTTGTTTVTGIAVVTTPTNWSCYNNTVRNLAAYSSGTSSRLIGIGTALSGTTATASVYNNTIHNLTTNSLASSIGSGQSSIQGILFGSANNGSVYGNTIYNISNINTTASTTSIVVGGIGIAAAQNTKVFNNRIYNLSNANRGTSPTAPPIVAGIFIRSGTTTDSVYNNMISIGDTTNKVFVGIYAGHGSTPDPTSYIFHNSVHISGVQNSGSLPSFCFHRGDFSTTLRNQVYFIENNIFNNVRTNSVSATGRHYAIGNNFGINNTSTGWNSSYNILNTSDPSIVGSNLNFDLNFSNLTSVLNDVGSINNATVVFVDPSTADLHINMGLTSNFIESFGDASVGITTDFDGQVRPGPVGSVNGGALAPDMGADEFDGVPNFTCSTPVVANVNATVNPITCYGSATLLSLSITHSGTGNTYQWQSSIDNVNFTNINSATNPTFSAVPTDDSTYYRCVVTCGNGPVSTNSNSLLITAPQPLAGGTYTINSSVVTGGNNFNNFTDAFAALNCRGIDGPIVLNVAAGSGPYVEQVSLVQVLGSSSINTITINGNGRTLSFNSTDANNRTGILLNGSDFVTIDNLTIDGSAGTFGICVLLTNNANNNTISNCTLITSPTSTTSTNTAGIALSGSATTIANGVSGSNNLFTGNTIDGGYYSIYLTAPTTAANYANNNTVSNSIITNFYFYGVYGIYQNGLTVSGCDISRPTRTNSSSAYGVISSTGGSNIKVFNNRVHNIFDAFASTHTNTFYGIYLSSTGTALNPNLAYNNLVYNIAGNGTIYGLYVAGTMSKFYHNTVVLNNQNSTSGSTYGIYHSGTSAGQEIKNNLVYLTRTGTGLKRALYFSSANTNTQVDNNAYYFAPVGGVDNYLVGYTSTNDYSTLIDWKASNGNIFDQNSYSGNPQFVDIINNDFTPNSGSMDNKGTNVGITSDINATTRSNTTPDIGAIEYTGAGCQDPPTPGTATSTVSTVCPNVNFTLSLTGQSTGAGQTYQWQVSSNNVNWTDIGSSLTTPDYQTSISSTSYFRVGLTCSGGTTVYSTSVLVNIPVQLNGTYTINKNAAASSTNFTSFANAFAAMECGIGGPITLDVVAGSGPYTEQINIPLINGSSAVNRVTINGNNNLINPTVNSTSNRGIITLDGADYITIKNFNINASLGTHGIGILLTNNAQYDSIINCVIDAGVNVTSTNYAGIAAGTKSSATGAGNNASNCVILDNTIIGGYYGISFSNQSGNQGANNRVINNNVEDVYLYHIYGVYQTDMFVSGNRIYSLNRTTYSTTYAIYFSTGSEGCTAEKNKIYNMYLNDLASTSSFYGLYCSGTPTAAKPHNFVNNLVDNILNGGGLQYGIYITDGFANIHHNTIVLDNTSSTAGTTYGVYETSTDSVNFKNNIIYITRSGTGTKRAIFLTNLSSGDKYDNNNYYFNVSGGTNNHLGSVTNTSTNFTTLNDWKAANSNLYDQNSVSMLISFADPANQNFKPITNAFNNLGTYAGVNFDIQDLARNNSTPDIGAYEFDIVTCTGTPSGGTISGASGTICQGTTINLDLVGATYGDGIVYQWQTSTNGSNWSNLGNAEVTSILTYTQNTTTYYRCAVTCTTSAQTAFSNVLYLETPALVSGTFTIDKTQPTAGNNFNSFAEAISYISCGINGPVVFNVVSGSGPYSEQVNIPTIFGSSSTNTITINGNNESIVFNSTQSSQRAGITLDGTDWVTINNFTIDGSSGSYGWGILLTSNADNNSINGITIELPRNTTSTFFGGVLVSGSKTSFATGASGSNNTVTNCTINGGYYGVSFTGPSSAPLATNNRAVNCTLVDQYIYPLYCLYQDGAFFTNNEVYKTTNRTSYTTGYGVLLSTGNVGVTVEKNRIHNLFEGNNASTSTQYCLYNSASTGTVAKPNRFINNLIYNIDGAGIQYGIYLVNAANTHCYHNTIVLNNSTAATTATYGIYQTTASTGIQIRNNNVFIARAGTGLKRLIHFNTTTSTIVSNNNNFFFGAISGTDNHLGQYGTTNFNTLANWKTANGSIYDQNSVNVNPQFANIATGNFAATATGLNGVGASGLGVSEDILGSSRTIFFTPGAYEVDNSAPVFANHNTTVQACSQNIGANSLSISGVVITDATGVNLNGTLKPTIYFRKGSVGAWSSSVGTLTSGNANNGTWDFEISYNTLGTINNGDVIQYFIGAQDTYITPNVGFSVSGVSASAVNSILVYPTNGTIANVVELTPTINISTASNSVCSGNSVTFNASATNAGSSPIYQWRKNNTNIGVGSTIVFAPNTLVTGDVITCLLTSNAACLTTQNASSNSITVTVNQSPSNVTITNNLTSSAASSITACSIGRSINFYPSSSVGVWSSSNPSVLTISPTNQTGNAKTATTVSNGTASLIYTISNSTTGCSSASSVEIIVAAEPTPNTINGVNSICVGSTSAFTTSSTGGFWSTTGLATINSLGNLTSTSAGTTTVRYTTTNANGCSASATKTLVINPLPAIPSIGYGSGTVNPQAGAPSGLFCTNRTFNLIGIPSGGAWSSTGVVSITVGGSATTGSVAGTGSITYTITNANGCSNRRTIGGITTTACASRGVNNNTLLDNTQFVLYPNPAKNFVNISVDKLIGESSITITDMYGKIIKTVTLTLGNNVLDLKNYSKGVYLVTMKSGKEISTKKLIVE